MGSTLPLTLRNYKVGFGGFGKKGERGSGFNYLKTKTNN